MTAPEPPRAGEPETARHGKSAAAFRTISEVADELDLPTHVLRFWESKFPQVKPLKRGGGRRYYRPEDVDAAARIRQCLYQHGYTIRGVQKLLRDGAVPRGGRVAGPCPQPIPPPARSAPPPPSAPRRRRRAARSGGATIAPAPTRSQEAAARARARNSQTSLEQADARTALLRDRAEPVAAAVARPRTQQYDPPLARSRLGRSVAQPGSASAWGAEGREFESLRSDQPPFSPPASRRIRTRRVAA